MSQWLDGASIVLTWAVLLGLALVVAFMVIRFLFRLVTYKPSDPHYKGRAKVFAEALATLRAGKQYHLKNLDLFDGSSEKLRFFAEALSGQLDHRVMFDEISFGTSGEVVFSTGAEEEE